MVRWKPTRYAVIVGFMAVNQAVCATPEQRRFASAVVKATADEFYAVKRDFDRTLGKMSFMEPGFADECAKFESGPAAPVPRDVLLLPEVWAWFRPIFEAHPDGGACSVLRVAADVSVAEAKEQDVALAG